MPIRGSLGSLTGIIKQTSKTFIDTKGTPFIYENSFMSSKVL